MVAMASERLVRRHWRVSQKGVILAQKGPEMLEMGEMESW
jgi:hypothetical protein